MFNNRTNGIYYLTEDANNGHIKHIILMDKEGATCE